MKLKDELLIKKVILTCLNANEQLLAFNFSRDRRSIYVSLLQGNINYLSFRISNHSSYSGFYSNRTFKFNRDNLSSFQKELAQYIVKSQWYTFRYGDFFLLYTIKLANEYHISFLIDNLFEIFSNEDMGIVFYQERIFGKKKKEVDIVSERMTKYLRKLYATGLLNSFQKTDNGMKVFITEQGMRMLDAFLEQYLDKYLEDYQQIDWDHIEIPISSEEDKSTFEEMRL